MKPRVACNLCIKAYDLPIKLLGKHMEICYWCCARIYDEEKMMEKNENERHSTKKR